ncbi:isocitrate lyase/PEP mutase family protein [Tropicimonas isoalkanivorans]|uniref:Phosphoenolpyruvate phosphomutase n=1 Tax=Tropicimonas isoalkanivorans TaxID=441112 RepID=A0A1I1MN09_9RHOB|nr:isocitrate lyase/PEP mutase family protein [Tropicimonas isoalkanivorans]SFC86476.1 Phosphoenolpyruvate phosphomutase [Tropicimonas isoalkanivorans]
MTTAGPILRRIINDRRAVLVPGVMNALAARIAEDAGFEALYVTGAGVSNAYLGLPDVAFLSLTQLADHVAAIRNVTKLPLIVDGDTGFGNEVNTWHTIRTLERAGANAVQLEDQVFPKRCGHFDGKSVVGVDEMARKIAAAADARHDPDFLIIGRTDAYATEGLDAALDRARRYISAGADMTFVEAPRRIEDISRIATELEVPQVVNIVIGGKTPPMEQAELARAGVGIALYANAALQGAMLGMKTALSALMSSGKLTEDSGLVVPFEERQRLVGKPHVDAIESKFVDL